MANQFEIIKQENKLAAAAAAGEYLNAFLKERSDLPTLLMLSAGSAIEILDYIGESALGENLTISVLDERFSTDPKINNFELLQKTEFYKEALEKGCSFFGTLPRKEDSMQSLAERWESNLKNWKTKNPEGLIVATLGMGPDGHTAGIFADDDQSRFEELFDSEPWIAAYNVGAKSQYPERVTTTLTFFKLINVGVGFIVGLEKKEKFTALVKNQGQVNLLPALAWHGITSTKIYTDIS